VHDWLQDMMPPGVNDADKHYEIKFKSTRKAYFSNPYGLEIYNGDLAVVEADRGIDMGWVTMSGELVKLRMSKEGVEGQKLPAILRVANEEDRQQLERARSREYPTLLEARQIIKEMGLQMKLSDVEFQADEQKAHFYYTAEGRVDFRELVKVLANRFHTRIQMRQIGLRQEAGLIGGLGSCGRELCCSSWLKDFRSVSANAARYQNLSLNTDKIIGQCGRLKCCLNYELDTYLEALADFPEVTQLSTQKGTAYLQKTDVFRERMWFSMEQDQRWVMLTPQQVKEIYTMNQAGKHPESLQSFLKAELTE
jgi:cell fate regulator YaaT (PSP1 superfamily)